MTDTITLSPFSPHKKLGIEITRASAAKVIGPVSVTENTQSAGLLHGGATMVLVEGLTSLAAWLYVQSEWVAMDVDLNLIHPRPVVSGRVTGRAVPVHLRNGVTIHTVEMHDEEGRFTAVGRLTS